MKAIADLSPIHFLISSPLALSLSQGHYSGMESHVRAATSQSYHSGKMIHKMALAILNSRREFPMFGLDESDEKPRRLKLPQMRERGIVKVMILFLPLIFAKTEKQLQKTSEVPRCVRVAPGRGGGVGRGGGRRFFCCLNSLSAFFSWSLQETRCLTNIISGTNAGVLCSFQDICSKKR